VTSDRDGGGQQLREWWCWLPQPEVGVGPEKEDDGGVVGWWSSRRIEEMTGAGRG
jgi:hypothetical protein